MKIADFSINDVAALSGGKIRHYHNNAVIQQIVYDTRSVFIPSASLFIAINTGKRNGHDFITDAYKKGIRNFIVDQEISFPGNDVNVVLVEDSIKGLQRWASSYREQLKCPLIAITGSNGKTTLKEWLNQVLSSFYVITRSPRSFNSQLGVPLSVLQIEKSTKLAIIEVGISKPGEMDALATIVKPDISILTNVEQAHAVNFESRIQHIREKLKLASASRMIVYCSDDQEIIQNAKPLMVQQMTWGFESGHLKFTLKGNELSVTINNKQITFRVNVYDKGSLQNICHLIAACFSLGIEPEKLSAAISEINSVEMRFELKEGINNCKILNDTYSLDFYSFQLAVEYVTRNAGELSKTVIISDFPEFSGNKESFYRNVGRFLTNSAIQKVIGIGDDIQEIKSEFKGEFIHFNSTQEFIAKVNIQSFTNEMILVKGSRVSHFENIVSFFDLKLHSTYLQVDLAAIQHNLNYYQSLVKPGTKFMVMVKALAYGSGSREISHLLEFNKVDYLAVAYADEGVELRKSGVRLPIMVMNPDEGSFGLLTQYDLQPEVYNFHQFHQLLNFLELHDKNSFSIHIKINTGMHRLGFNPDEIEDLIRLLKEKSNTVKVESVFTHLSSADVLEEDNFTKTQFSVLENSVHDFHEKLGYRPLMHALNSPGIERFSSHAYNMVRLGIGLHGIAATADRQKHLLPVHRLISKVSHINRVKSGDTVGYSRKGKINTDKVLAVIPIGYADGYFRAFGNGVGKVSIHGKLAPVIGNVCMDMIMVDITDIPQTQIDDEVIIFGPELPVTEVASWINTIPYELLTSVSTRVKRVYIDHV